jgi:hypothetical protein
MESNVGLSATYLARRGKHDVLCILQLRDQHLDVINLCAVEMWKEKQIFTFCRL